MIKRVLLSLFCLFSLLISFVNFQEPIVNWDMLPYMAIILENNHPERSNCDLHSEVYSLAEDQL